MKLNHLFISSCLNRYSTRFFNTQGDKINLIKKISSNRTEWEKSRKETQEHTSINHKTSDQKSILHTGFGKAQNTKSRVGLKYLGKLQTISKSTPEEKVNSLFAEISSLIDDFTPYELIELGYFLTRINRPNCSKLAEPVLHRFFKLPNRHSCLNGVYLHRLLRTMFIFQDVTYRVWVYEIAQMVSNKHDHLIMRDIQLIVDDLSLFYDAAAQGALNQLENSVVARIHDLDFYRLPLIIHALGRCGYNTINVAKAVHDVYIKNKGHFEYYSSHLIGLLLKGYNSFHFNPGKEFLDEVWGKMKDILHKVEFKYISWIMESFLKLRYFKPISVLLDELIDKHKILSHLEFTDFINGCWSIQSHLLSLEFKTYLVPGSIWQDLDINEEGNSVSDTEFSSLSPEHNDKQTLDTLYKYYKKLIKLILREMPSKIYESTPPYRATQFELITRLLEVYPNPRDFRIPLPLMKFDNTFPILEFPSSSESPKVGQLEYIFTEMDYLSCSNFFGTNKRYGNDKDSYSGKGKDYMDVDNTRDMGDDMNMDIDMDNRNLDRMDKDSNMGNGQSTYDNDDNENIRNLDTQSSNIDYRNVDDLVLDIREEPLKSKLSEGRKVELKPLHPLLKQYIHSFFFRTPALAPRGIRLLIQGLVRIHFEQREDCLIDKDLIPNMKIKYYSRPLSKAIMREVFRKLACFNPDDLIVSLFGMLALKMYDLELSKDLFDHAIPMWLHQKNEKRMIEEQKETLSLFFKTLEQTYPSLYSSLDKEALKTILE